MTHAEPSLAGRVARALQARLVYAKWELERTPGNTVAWLKDRAGRRQYRPLSVADLRATRTKDTVFAFGSGASIRDISPAGWDAIAQENTISFREFPRQSFVRADYHFSGEVDDIHDYARRLRDNPLYRSAVMVVQEGWHARSGNALVGRGLLPPGARLFRYRRTARGIYAGPSERFEDGLVHGFGTVIGVVNFAYLMGWRTIVLAGIDLYDKRYFWLPDDQTRSYEKAGITPDTRFTGADQIAGMLGRWRELLARRGVSLEVLSERSLLAGVMPVYRMPPA